MLKLKEDADLTKLIDLGFKPRYNEDTGEIDSYLLNEENYHECLLNGKYTPRFIEIFKKKKETVKKEFSNVKFEVKIGYFIGYCYADWQFDILYDLIQEGLVEKTNERYI